MSYSVYRVVQIQRAATIFKWLFIQGYKFFFLGLCHNLEGRWRAGVLGNIGLVRACEGYGSTIILNDGYTAIY